MTPQEIYDGFTELLKEQKHLVCGSPGKHTVISCRPLYFHGVLTHNDAVFATTSVLLAMVHSIMSDVWWWQATRAETYQPFKVITQRGSGSAHKDGQIHLVPRHYFKQIAPLIYVSESSIPPKVSLNLQGQETFDFLKDMHVRFITQ